MTILPVIMSGGSGTRLWPLSTAKKAKQFHALSGELTMIQDTVLRLKSPEFEAPAIICGESHLDHVRSQLAAVDVKPSAIILEPMARNTAAVAAIAALYAAKTDPETLILLAPADHVITKPDAFHQSIFAAAELAKTRIVTFGISPTKPETGFGYIERGTALSDDLYEIGRFLEKPDYATAKTYVEGGKHVWNAGIFLFSAKVMLDALEELAPEVLAAAREAFDKASLEELVIRLDTDAFAKAPSTSIDYAVMEKTKNSAVTPCDIGWADLGSFAEIYNFGPKDSMGNFVIGNTTMIDASNCLVRAEDRAVAVIGLENIMVIATPEGILVAPIDRAQDVKKAYEAQKNR